jgi:uncharacterized protein (TIGR03437 family)
LIDTTGSGTLPGDTITVYLLGVSSLPATVLIRFTGQVSATIGNLNAPEAFSGLTPQAVGLEQVNLK